MVGSPGRAELHAANLRNGAQGGDGSDDDRSSPYVHDDYERGPSVSGGVRGARIRGLAGLVGDAVRKGAEMVARRRSGRR